MSPYGIVTTLLTLLALAALFSLRVLGLYSHQALAAVLLLGLAWAVASRGWLAWKGRLDPGLLCGFGASDRRPQLVQAVGRASFWAMAAAALVLAFDLGRAVWGGSPVGGPASVVEIAPPFEGEWLVAQGGRSPLQNHHLAAYNQHFALDLVRLDDGRIFTEETGNASVHSWEQPLVSPAEGTVVVARDGMDDSEGANFVSDPRDAAGNVVVIELDTGGFVVLAHLRRGTVLVSEGDRVRTGDPLARVGNSGNTTMPHLHLQVQTHRDLWDPDNRSVPFAFEPDGRILARNDRVGVPGR